MNTEERLEAIEFEPVSLTTRRRRIEPAAIGTAFVALALVVAVAKPWAGAPTAAEVSAASPPGTPVQPAAASGGPSAAASPGGIISPSPAKILRAIGPHEAWGVRAVVRGPAGPGNPDGPEYRERWARVLERTDGSELAILGTGDESVVALGVTSPASETPVDVRVWRPTAQGDWELLDVRPVATGTPSGEVYLKRPTDEPGAPETWPAGSYRIELLLRGTHVRIIDVRLPGRFDRIPQPPSAALPPHDITVPRH